MRFGAIEAGGTKFVLGIGNELGVLEVREEIPTADPETTMKKVIEFFDKHENIIGYDAFGVGCFGPIDLNKDSETYGYITETPKIKWRYFNILGYLQKYYSVPIMFDTDVNGAALAELKWGAAENKSSSLYITVGTGIGGGAVVNNTMVHGLLHPEMGHIIPRKHPDDSFKGVCDIHGDCLEGLASGPAIEKRWGKSPKELPANHNAWKLEAFYLGQAIAEYILILSPEKIILGGGVMKQKQLFPLIREEVIKILKGYVCKKEIIKEIDNYIVSPKLGGDAGICGALALAEKALEKRNRR